MNAYEMRLLEVLGETFSDEFNEFDVTVETDYENGEKLNIDVWGYSDRYPKISPRKNSQTHSKIP
jgi:hypothetical protein